MADTRRRGTALDQAILSAAADELAESGYRQLVDEALVVPDTGELRGDVLAVLHQMNRDLSSPKADLLRGLLSSIGDEPELLAQLHEQVADGGTAIWLTLLGRAVARGEARPEALRPRVATVAITLLRNEYVTRGLVSVADDVIAEIVDEVYLPLVTRQPMPQPAS
jgi:hypothetical protein